MYSCTKFSTRARVSRYRNTKFSTCTYSCTTAVVRVAGVRGHARADGDLDPAAAFILDLSDNSLVYAIWVSFILKRGSVQSGCILGGLRFRSTAMRIFKFVWYFQQQVFHQFFLRNGSN